MNRIAASPPVRILASLACADPLHLADALAALQSAGIDGLHVDIMDGCFVPNFGLSLDLVRAVRAATTLPLAVHLMVMEPERYIARAAEAGTSTLVIHQEATAHLHRTLEQIGATGMRAGVALNPATPLETLEYVLANLDELVIMTVDPGFAGQMLIPSTLRKIVAARALVERRGMNVEIAADGNVSFAHAPEMVRAGANVLVGGSSSIFSAKCSVARGVAQLRATTRNPVARDHDLQHG